MYGKLIEPSASTKAHYGGHGVKRVGLFAYNFQTDTLRWQPYEEGLEHDLADEDKARGRVYREDGRNVVVIYTGDPVRDLSSDTIERMVSYIVPHIGFSEFCVVDEIGRDLIC